MYNKFLLLFFILFFLSQECQINEIERYNNLCISIENLLENKYLQLDLLDINHFTSEIKSISQNGYNLDFLKLDFKYLQSKKSSKSKLYISEACLNIIKLELNINISNAMVIIASNSNKKNENGVPESYFIIRYSSTLTGKYEYINSQIYDFTICNSDPILLSLPVNIDTIQIFKKKERENAYDPDVYELSNLNIDRILYAQKYNIDLFNIHSDFFENICFKFKSEKGSDVTLETRLLEYYQNITLCDIKQNEHYMYFNYSELNRTLVYTCAYGFYKDEEEKNDYIEKIDEKVNLVFRNSNFKVITCTDELFKNKNILSNYGLMICAFVLLMQIIFFFSYFCVGTKPLKNQINKLIKKASQKNENSQPKEKEFVSESERVQIDKTQNQNNNNDQIKNKQNQNNKFPPQDKKNNEINEIKNNENSNDPPDKNNENLTNPNDKEFKSNNTYKNRTDPNDNDSKYDDTNKSKTNPNGKDSLSETSKSPEDRPQTEPINDDNEGDFDKNTEISEKQDVEVAAKDIGNQSFQKLSDKEKIKIEKIMKKKNNQIFEYDNDDLNELSFSEAKLFDKRTFCVYYCFMIQKNHIIINTFCRKSDYNLFSIKLSLLLFLFPINLAFNAFFFTSEQIQSVYVNKLSDISIDWQNFVRSFAASIISSIILLFLKLLCLSHNSIRKLKKNKNIEDTKKDMVWTLRCIKLRIFIYYLISIAFIIVFGFYIACFCEIFENTQILLLWTMAFSWVLNILYPFVVCFITSIFRRGALTCGKKEKNNRRKGIKCCYRINKILQMI